MENGRLWWIFPAKAWRCSVVILVYQRVTVNTMSHSVTDILILLCEDRVIETYVKNRYLYSNPQKQ